MEKGEEKWAQSGPSLWGIPMAGKQEEGTAAQDMDEGAGSLVQSGLGLHLHARTSRGQQVRLRQG